MFMGVKLGRTTSAISDEDSSFYLWKWFIRQRKVKPLKRKRKKRKFRRFDYGDEQMWYFNFMTRKVGGSYFPILPGPNNPVLAIRELRERRQAHYIFPGEGLDVLESLFPKLRRVFRKRPRRGVYRTRFKRNPLKQMYSDMSRMW